MARTGLSGLTAEEISDIVVPAGFSQTAALAVCNDLYRKRTGEIPGFGKTGPRLRNFLSENFDSGIFPPLSREKSSDNTVKYLFRTGDGRFFETVFIPEKGRNTVCVSTQSGCRMGCRFCVTAGYGFHGNLTAGEILNQVLAIPETGGITHVVMMGMGEPMDNLDSVLKTCNIITAGWGLAISRRNVTVSTVGLAPGIGKFLEASDCNLTVSLLSPFPDERKMFVPAENKYPVRTIIDLLKPYPLAKKRRISLAYMMIDGFNDSERHLRELKSLLKGSSIRVNLLPFHSIPGDGRISSSETRMQYFRHELVISGISASVRKSRGADISAACGLLASDLSKSPEIATDRGLSAGKCIRQGSRRGS